MAQRIPVYSGHSGLVWSANNTLTINKPAGVVKGDLMIAQVGYDTTLDPVSEPSGWTRFYIGPSIGNAETAVYWKIAGASEPANYSWTFNVAGPSCGGGITRIKDNDRTNPILWAGTFTGTSDTMEYPGQAGLPGTFGVFGFGYHDDAIPTYSVDHYVAYNPNGIFGLCAGRQTLPNSGTVASNIKTVSSSGNWAATRVVVKGLIDSNPAMMMGCNF